MPHCLRLITTLGTLLSCALTHSASATPVSDKPNFPTLIYWDNWTDKQGVSHLTKCKLSAFRQTPSIAGEDKVWAGTEHTGMATVITKVQPPKWKGGWSETRQVQWVVPLSGTYFVQAMDGTSVELNAGDMLLSEDQNSVRDHDGHVGHLSGNVGDDAVALMITQFANARASHIQCDRP
ncbi:hypothetical protein JK185_11055 [Gluconobacter wancherniae]|uniref:hypothetical protein n=1 Tax=Gluconobacter wancherniae TaxID=1307955 RepID=UPI001B8C4F8A|nr:hypothetical protein [Gluconobacter wancherniae]MBS1063577.1 hypothetical protein [Gluconobacter wancherniae]